MASAMGWRCPLQTTELTRRPSRSAFRLGTVKSVSKVPILPPWFSRARNLRRYLPGESVKPVSYWMFLPASCAAPSPILTLMVSRTLLDLPLGVGDLADEVEFRGIAGAAARQGDFAAGDLDRDRHKVMPPHQTIR